MQGAVLAPGLLPLHTFQVCVCSCSRLCQTGMVGDEIFWACVCLEQNHSAKFQPKC